MQRAVAFAVAVSVAAALVGAVLIPTGPAASTSVQDGSADNSFNWTAPIDASGPLAVEVRVDLSGNEDCTVEVGLAGDGEPLGLPGDEGDHGRLKGFSEIRADGVAIARGVVPEEDGVQVHAGETVDTREAWTDAGAWWVSSTGQLDGSDDRLRIFAHHGNLSVETEMDRPPVEISVVCEAPFDVLSVASDRSPASFTQNTLDGGAGASVSGSVAASATVSDGLQRTLHGDYTRLRVVGVERLATSRTDLRLDHPGGTERWTYQGPADIDLGGEPGAYEMTLTRLGGGRVDGLYGVLTGLSHIQDLDEVI